ncbi:MAG: tetratricopeptide repeat protein [Paracoccus sp.]|nr:tetratricopeptide repeat protein [Paracoccus sp. (in: a-proteobacteria)]
MAFHSHGDKLFEAQRVFTDREQPIALFEQAFAESQERDDHRVICWHGIGGQGKSSLHDEIRRRISDNSDVALAGLDFDVPRHRRLEDAMLKLRGDLSGRGLSFPTFDLAFARHFALERPGENIREVHPQLYRRGESQIVDDMIDWSEAGVDLAVEGISLAVPGLNLLYKYGARLTGRLRDWWASQAVKGKLVGLDEIPAAKLAERLPQYLGFDIWRSRAEIGCPRIVITIDTHEKLGQGELRGDDWLQTLVRETPGALILIFGRDRLRWAELDDRWEDVLDQHLLGALSDEDADSFLAQVPIPEADMRARIVGSAEGLPHYLDLAVSTYEDILKRGETPVTEDFGTTPVKVRERFLDHLPPEERRELFLASYSESLSERLFLDLADAFLGGAGNVSWTRLKRRSFMTEGSDGRLVIHALMREALQEQDEVERSELFARVHEWLFERYAARTRVTDALSVTSEAERAFIASCSHAARLSRDHLIEWIEDAYQPFHAAARWRTLEKVHGGALDWFPEPSADRTWLLHALALVRMAMGHYAEAASLFEEALDITKAAVGDAHPEYAVPLHGLAQVRHTMGRYKEATSLFEQVLAIEKVAFGETHPEYAATMHARAGVHLSMGRFDEAEALFEQALAIKKIAHGEEHLDYAETLQSLAEARQSLGRSAEADGLLDRVLKIKKAALGEAHPDFAKTLYSLAWGRQAMGRNAEAASLFEQVLEIQKTGLGEAHTNYAATLHQLAGVHLAMGHQTEAEALYERALEINQAAVGDAHQDYADTLDELASVRQAMGRNLEAEALFEQALAIKKTAVGEAHPAYATTLYNLADVRRAMGRNAEAEALFKQALEIFKTALSEVHTHAIMCLASLAECRACLGRVGEARDTFGIALEHAEALSEGARLWSGRVRLRWAHGLLGAGLKDEATDEACAARDLLAEVLGAEAALVEEADTLIRNVGAAD